MRIGGLQFETDRARFLGRGRDPAQRRVDRGRPAAVEHRRGRCSIRCSRCAGACASHPAKLRASPFGPASAPAARMRSHWSTSIATWRPSTATKTLAWTQAQVQLRYLGIDFDEAQQFQRIANRVLYSDSSLRAPRDILDRNQLGPSALWACKASPAICRSCWCGSTMKAISKSSDSCCARTSTGGSSGWRSISSS